MRVFNLNYRLIYTENIPEGFGALCEYSRLPLFGKCTIKIRPKYKEDKGLLEHELVHAKQYSENIFHALRVKFDKSYRYQCELEAYSKQAKVYAYVRKEQYVWMAEAISGKYGLNVSIDTALEDLWRLNGKMLVA